MRYAVFAYDDIINKYNEYIYDEYAECEAALEIFYNNEIAAFICVSDESMEGKIAEVLLRPGACFNA
jgi:hypothetical protein